MKNKNLILLAVAGVVIWQMMRKQGNGNGSTTLPETLPGDVLENGNGMVYDYNGNGIPEGRKPRDRQIRGRHLANPSMEPGFPTIEVAGIGRGWTIYETPREEPCVYHYARMTV
jgi:hypothetical protein